MSSSIQPTASRLPLTRIAQAGLLAIVAAVVVNVVIWWIGSMLVQPPADFTPLASPVPTIMFTTIFLVGATLVYAAINARSSNPPRLFLIVSVIALVLGFIPDIMLLVAPASTPMGTPTVPAVLVLILMHLAAYAITLWAFLRWAPQRQ